MLSTPGAEQTEAAKRIETILLVEDNEISLEMMHSQLIYLGYQVDTAADGQQALSMYRKKPYDLVLTDLEMPDMDGYELTREIRRLQKDAVPPIIIFAITASDFDLTDEHAKSLGFDGYMLKPLEVDILEKKLGEILRNL
ncbi:MAG: response regulator [Desulfobacterales bacterium]